MQQNQVIDKLHRLTVSSDIVSTHVYPEDYRHLAAETIGLCGHVCDKHSPARETWTGDLVSLAGSSG